MGGSKVIIYYSGRTTPIETNAPENLIPGVPVMMSFDTWGGYPDQRTRLDRLMEDRVYNRPELPLTS